MTMLDNLLTRTGFAGGDCSCDRAAASLWQEMPFFEAIAQRRAAKSNNWSAAVTAQSRLGMSAIPRRRPKAVGLFTAKSRPFRFHKSPYTNRDGMAASHPRQPKPGNVTVLKVAR
jgi:hypothetical protein